MARVKINLDYPPMRLVTLAEASPPSAGTAAMVSEPVGVTYRAKASAFGPPMDYEAESTTVWSFPERGNWATHNGSYRGNWSPYVPRNLILKYTLEGDTVLDQMCGSGTTLVECKLLGRNGIGVDINPQAVTLTLRSLDFETGDHRHWTQVYVGDSRNLNEIQNESIDLIATHPPYAGMIAYSRRTIDADLSALSVPVFASEMYKVAKECIRVLKPGKYCGVLIGDTRKHLHYVPISFLVENMFFKAGFLIKEDIIKLQWKAKGTRERWRGKSYDFYKIAHEHLFVFRKPKAGEKLSDYKLSSCGLLSVVAGEDGWPQDVAARKLSEEMAASPELVVAGPRRSET